MAALGWEQCDVIIVTGDAYVDHPSFGMAIVGRVLEAQGLRVGIIAQPDWHSADAFRALGAPRLFFGITAGNMDSMVNRYTADKRVRSDDAYTPGGAGRTAARPLGDRLRAARARGVPFDVPIVIGGIEASLRRIAHFDYWSEKVRRSVLLDAKADLLVYGNGERQISEIAQRLDAGERDRVDIRDIRGTAFAFGAPEGDWIEIDSTHLDAPGALNAPARSLCDAARGAVHCRASGCRGRSPASKSCVSCAACATAIARAQRYPPAGLRAGGRRIRCCTRTPRASCTWSPIRATRARWCSGTARRTYGSIRRRFR